MTRHNFVHPGRYNDQSSGRGMRQGEQATYQGLTLAGRYRLDSLVGEGGMGQVWRGTDLRLDRPIAVKLLPKPPGNDQRPVERFGREATIAARLQHPAITVVFDFDTQDDLVYLVMELLEGTDLATMMTREPQGLPIPLVLSIGIQVADALAAAHAKDVVHRDIKPGNIILLPGDRVKICDFGIARYTGAVTNLTAGLPLGTPSYMAPEQFENSGAVDGRADLYALGGTLYMLATGREAFTADSLHALMKAVLNDPPHNPRDLRPDMPADLAQLILALLAKDPGERPATAEEVRAALRAVSRHRVLNGSSAQQSPESPESPEEEPQPTRRLTVVPDLASAQREGIDHYEREEYERALPCFRAAVKVRTEALGADHPDTLTSRDCEGWTLYWMDRETEALPVAEEVAAARARVLGARHPDTLDSRDLMARCLYRLERYAEALPVLREVVRAHAQLCGPDDPRTLHDRSMLARTLLDLSRAEEALPIARETAEGRIRVLGPDHRDTLASRNLVGRALYALGRYQEALPIFREVADARARVLGPDHRDTQRSMTFTERTLRRLV
jgi:serine/threonine protein kinase